MASNSIVSELRNNPRLRIGIWLILAILAGYSLIIINDYQKKIEANYNIISNKFNKLQIVTKQTEWPKRAEEAHSFRIMLEDKLWIANSKGLAQADFQAWLLIQAKSSKIENYSLKTEDTTEVDNGKLWRVVGKLEGNFSSDTLNRLLLSISQHPQMIVIEKLDIRSFGRRSVFTLVVSAYFQAPKPNKPNISK